MSDKFFRIVLILLGILAGIGLLMGVTPTFGISLFSIILFVEFKDALNPNIGKYNYSKKFFHHINRPRLYQNILLCLLLVCTLWAIWTLIEPFWDSLFNQNSTISKTMRAVRAIRTEK